MAYENTGASAPTAHSGDDAFARPPRSHQPIKLAKELRKRTGRSSRGSEPSADCRRSRHRRRRMTSGIAPV